jgi:hypothetical protein
MKLTYIKKGITIIVLPVLMGTLLSTFISKAEKVEIYTNPPFKRWSQIILTNLYYTN